MEKTSNTQWLVRATILLVVLLCLYLVMKLSPMWLPILNVFVRVLIPFLIAGLITYLLHPIIEKSHATGIPRPIAVLLIYFLFFGGIIYAIYKGTPYIINQLKELIENLPVYINEVHGWFTMFSSQLAILPQGMQVQVEEWFQGLEGGVEQVFESIVVFLKGLLSSFIYFIIIPFLVFYLLKDFKLIEKVAWYLTPKRWRKEGIAFIRDVDHSFGNYIRGQILVSLSVGILATIGLWIIGMPYPILLGMFIGMMDIIPYFGAFMGAVPAVLVAALQSWNMVLLTVLVIFVLQQVEGNILSPVIVGKTLHMHPVLIMLALIVGIEIGGILGLVLAVPTLAIVKVVLLHLRTNLHNEL
ncbi:AI-2E family transporter [Bacillus alkalicellulosilyticus]|uniref:AI-2E family transporter n=1 Tax=Alkalihalobacterium alkalicellulosilyticum TaxID=1912214 RepID=UPI000998E477|nr:AI-2E family transporter [Bacillus alkalicellulosilyticus]